MPNKTSDAVKILDAIAGNDPERRIGMAEARLNGEISQIIYDAREASGVSQRELARRMGTSQSAISRQECLDYRGHTISMIARMLAAMGLELVVSVRPLGSRASRSAKPAAKVKRSAGPAIRHPLAAKER